MRRSQAREDFRDRFGAVCEHSPWLAEEVFDRLQGGAAQDPEPGPGELAAHFQAVLLAAGPSRQRSVLQAHPMLACRLAGAELSPYSRAEQRGSGLDQCSRKELKLFMEYNDKYMKKNKYPFIIAVKGRTRSEILDQFAKRLQNDTDTEFRLALRQVCRIMQFRIEDIMGV